MNKRILYVIALILLCCGCSTKYTIEIDENLGVKEYAKAVETDEFFEQYPNSSVERVIGFLLEPNLEYLNRRYASQRLPLRGQQAKFADSLCP